MLMEEIVRSPVEVGSWNPTIYKVFYIPGGAGFLPSTVWIRVNLTIPFKESTGGRQLALKRQESDAPKVEEAKA